jgi:hypothetical protein
MASLRRQNGAGSIRAWLHAQYRRRSHSDTSIGIRFARFSNARAAIELPSYFGRGCWSLFTWLWIAAGGGASRRASSLALQEQSHKKVTAALASRKA